MVGNATNIIVMGLHRSGTSIATAMLRDALNLSYAPDANWGGESDRTFLIHDLMANLDKHRYDENKFDIDLASAVFGDLRPPWIIKDPAWCITLPIWWPVIEHTDRAPILIWVGRDRNETHHAWIRRANEHEQLLSESHRSGTKIARPNGGMRINNDGRPVERRTGIDIDAYLLAAQRTFDWWPAPKLKLEFERLTSAIARFDSDLIHRAPTTPT